jgi:hypothetical protein
VLYETEKSLHPLLKETMAAARIRSYRLPENVFGS